MRSFKAEDYSAKSESRSQGAKDGVLVIDAKDAGRGEARRATCLCGCGEVPKGKKAKFAMGHDARLKGMLIRAELAGVEVELTRAGKTKTVAAAALAKELGWGDTQAKAVKAHTS